MKQGQKLDPFTQAIAAFDWPGTLAALNARATQTSVSDACDHLFERIEQSGRLLLQRPDAELGARRDEYVGHVLAHAKSANCEEMAGHVEQHLAGIKLVETGFHAVLDAMREGPNAALAPDVHVWALLTRFAEENLIMENELQAAIASKPFLFDPYSVHATNADGHAYRPDTVTGGVVEVLSSAFLMFGYQNGWFTKDGALQLPAPCTLPADATFRAGLTLVLGQGWRLLDFSQERWRFFGGSVRSGKHDFTKQDGTPGTVSTIEFEADLGIELFDNIAHERLNRLFVGIATELNFAGPQAHVHENDDTTNLAPTAFISAAELYTTVALCHALHFDVSRDENRYAGLRFREWMRGYAWLVREADRASPDPSTHTLSWTPAELVARLEQVGLDRSIAETFITNVTFGRRHGDLFDAPLLKCADGRLYCLPHVLSITNIPRVILSHLGELEVQIGRKGRALEQEVGRIFEGAGHRGTGFKFKIDDEEYECDFAVIWDRKLFLFECKNRSLSGGKPSRIHRFLFDVLEAVGQLNRLKAALEDHPEIVKKHLGEDAEYDEIVLSALNGLPWSMLSDVDGVHVFDASALGKFFRSGTVDLQMPRKLPTGQTIVFRQPLRQIWAGDKPTAEDFLQQLRSPFQVELLRTAYGGEVALWPLSPALAIATPHVKMIPQSLDSSLTALAGKPMNSAAIERTLDAVRELEEQMFLDDGDADAEVGKD